ncbi:uncharacterized protein [Rutidosis leptorrhynchoides]|uniref:uncharacterized protein isoform X2 n=1 Tax=Rutidosis leptorrhynchoides TaxID=125765 RepID=UPI003A99C83F
MMQPGNGMAPPPMQQPPQQQSYQQQWMMQQPPHQQHQQPLPPQMWSQQQAPPQQQQQQQQQYRGGAPASSDEIKSLWIGDLQYWMDETYVANCFYNTGEVATVKIIRNKQTGQPEGYGFIEFRTRAGAEMALQTYNGTQMPSIEQTFRLNWAGERRNDDTPDYTIFVGDLAADVSDYILQETFKVVTDRTTGRSKGYGFVRFGDESEQIRAMSEMNGVLCSSRPMRIGPAATNKTGAVGGMQKEEEMHVYMTFKKINLDPLVSERPKTPAEIEADKAKDAEFEQQLKSPERPTEGGDGGIVQPSPDVEIIETTPQPSIAKKSARRSKREGKRPVSEATEKPKKRRLILQDENVDTTAGNDDESNKAVDIEDDSDDDDEETQDDSFETPPFSTPFISKGTGTTQSSSSSQPSSVVPLAGLKTFLEDPVNKSDSFVEFLKANTLADLSSSLSTMTHKQSCQSTAAALVLLNQHVIHDLKMQEAQKAIISNAVHNVTKIKKLEGDLQDASSKLRIAMDAAKKKDEMLQLVETKCVLERVEKEKFMEEKDKLLKENEELKKMPEDKNGAVEENVAAAASAEKNFVDLKAGLPSLVQRVLSSPLVGQTFHRYLVASTEKDLSDTVEEIVNALPDKPDPLPAVISKHIKPDADARLKVAIDEVSTLKIVTLEEVCGREDVSVKDILEVPI